MQRRLPAEWEPQDAVLLVWPHDKSDWLPLLDRITELYIKLTSTISEYEKVILVCRDKMLKNEVQKSLVSAGAVMKQIRFYITPTDDTWARDFGPITIQQSCQLSCIDFQFNAWGSKYNSSLDNQLTRSLSGQGLFRHPLIETGLFLEGGAIESDGEGTLLTTAGCLLSETRNTGYDRDQYQKEFAELLGIQQTHWLTHGHLSGDDTDGHIDTLARFCPGNTIAHVHCDDPTDPHFESITSMVSELQQLKTLAGKPYRLVPLPLPKARFNASGDRLPATYANFLIINGAVLMPTYDDPADNISLKNLQSCFPDRKIIGINCLAAIEQYGSLHCLTMQIPKGTLA